MTYNAGTPSIGLYIKRCIIYAQLLERGDLAAAGGLPQAWLAKARMQLQSCNHSGALETATQVQNRIIIVTISMQ